MSRFEVDSDLLATTSTQIQGSVDTLAGEVDLLMRYLDQLQGSWRGQAAVGFAAVAADWRITQERVKESLQAIQGALAVAGRQYDEVETSTARMFAG